MNKRSITRILAVSAVAAVAAGAMAGCATGGGEESGEVTLTWWHNATADPLQGLWADVAAEFEADHPGVTVEVTGYQNEDLQRTLIPNALASGDAPDVFMVWPGGEVRAQAEAGYLKDRFGAKAVTATPAGVERLLRGGGFDLLHFSGHGAARSDDIAEAKVLLKGQRRGTTVREQFLTSTDVSQNLDWTGPDSVGPIVVLNACQTGRSGELFTTVGGFAKAFLDAGASAFVSCLWSVQEEPARVFVETLYEELLKGTQMSRASALAREAARDADDPTWLAYVVYARPDAVLETV